MNHCLSRLATSVNLASLTREPLHLAFGLACATVYAYGGYAVNDPQSFASEFAWQTARFRELAGLDIIAAVVSA